MLKSPLLRTIRAILQRVNNTIVRGMFCEIRKIEICGSVACEDRGDLGELFFGVSKISFAYGIYWPFYP
jgi:hypothetical protein